MELSDLVNTKDKIVLDTSVTSPINGAGIIRHLSKGVKGLKKISLSSIDDHMERINALDSLNVNGRLVVIEEVQTEIKVGTDKLRIHTSHLSNARKETYTNRRSRKIPYGPNTTKIKRLKELADIRYGFLRNLRGNDPTTDMSENESATMLRYFEIASELAPSIPESRGGKMKREKLGDKQSLGDRLKTDKMIIAISYYLAHSSPVTILTEDFPLVRLAQAVGKRIERTEPREYKIVALNPDFKSPNFKNVLEVFNPSQPAILS